MLTSLASSIRRGIAVVLVLGAALVASAPVASAETIAGEDTITQEEPVVLETGEALVEASEFTATAELAAASAVKCKKVHGWHGLKHPLFGYFYWKYILTIRWCWKTGGSQILRTITPWSPTYWRDVECCLQFSGWNFIGHTGLDLDGGAGKGLYRVRAQGKFQQCYQFCFNTKTPWVRLTGYPGGGWGFAHGN